MNGKSDFADRPNRLPWPPMLYIGAILAALAIELVWPSGIAFGAATQALGWFGLAVGALFDLSAMVTMARAKANILPNRAATRLVTWGPFRLSRNPIYLGNTIMTASAAFAFGKLWLLPAAVLAAIATHHLAIRREEAHLDTMFGEDWRVYAGRVARWIGWPNWSQ